MEGRRQQEAAGGRIATEMEQKEKEEKGEEKRRKRKWKN